MHVCVDLGEWGNIVVSWWNYHPMIYPYIDRDLSLTYWHTSTRSPDPWPAGHLVSPAPKQDQWLRPDHSLDRPEGSYRCCFLHQKAEWMLVNSVTRIFQHSPSDYILDERRSLEKRAGAPAGSWFQTSSGTGCYWPRWGVGSLIAAWGLPAYWIQLFSFWTRISIWLRFVYAIDTLRV